MYIVLWVYVCRMVFTNTFQHIGGTCASENLTVKGLTSEIQIVAT